MFSLPDKSYFEQQNENSAFTLSESQIEMSLDDYERQFDEIVAGPVE